MRKFLCFFVIFIFAAPSLFCGEQNEPVLTILYSSSLNGNLDGCTCKSNPRAGLVKRAFFLNHINDRENTVLFDTGDILDVMPDKILADHLFSSYKELGYNIITVGDQEFLNGIEELLEYRSDFPIFSHNLYLCPDTKDSCVLFSLKPVIIKKKNISIGVFSLFDPGLVRFLKENIQDKIKVKSPVDVARIMVSLIKENKVDIIILLFHGYYKSAKELIREVEGIDIVILGHEQLLIDMKKIGETIFLSPGKEGNRLGKLLVIPDGKDGFTFNNSFRHFDYYSDPDDISIRKRIDEYYKEMMVE